MQYRFIDKLIVLRMAIAFNLRWTLVPVCIRCACFVCPANKKKEKQQQRHICFDKSKFKPKIVRLHVIWTPGYRDILSFTLFHSIQYNSFTPHATPLQMYEWALNDSNSEIKQQTPDGQRVREQFYNHNLSHSNDRPRLHIRTSMCDQKSVLLACESSVGFDKSAKRLGILFELIWYLKRIRDTTEKIYSRAFSSYSCLMERPYRGTASIEKSHLSFQSQ